MKSCTLGVGCDETGFCYAEAHGEPNQCGREEPPKFCPFCGQGSKNIVLICGWSAESDEDKDNITPLDEYQCHGECEGRSFWA